MITVTKRFSFCYGHHLPGYDGKCCQQHGHNSILEVEVAGDNGNTNVPDGMVIDFGDLKEIINNRIIRQLDHQNLNDLTPYPDPADDFEWNAMIEMPTAENMLKWILSDLSILFGESLIRVRISETPTSWAEWRK